MFKDKKMKNQLVTISFFKFDGIRSQFWAFRMMQQAHHKINQAASGLTFYKLLGTGGNNGFSWKPNLTVYGLLMVWKDKAYAENFFENSDIFKAYLSHSEESFTVHLQASESHGKWANQEPFSLHESGETGKIAVLTRATIRWNKLISFWRRVYKVSESLDHFPGRLFSIGIGEWPWIQQATFSLWDSKESMVNYAYKNPHHREVIRLTREKKWYKEELFARFTLIKTEGSWSGMNLKSLQQL